MFKELYACELLVYVIRRIEFMVDMAANCFDIFGQYCVWLRSIYSDLIQIIDHKML